MEFFRFPKTPHLASLTNRPLRGDKVFSRREAQQFLENEVVVEEKVDGTNVGLSVANTGRLRAQSRGSFVSRETKSAQFKPFFRWMEARQDALIRTLGPHLILFGEWCFAVHSVHYTKLPDWFLAFDVYNRSNDCFWSVERRDALVRDLGIASVPLIARGRFDL